jgi:AAHS family 4-hydroxybenzoate transporter-like MFS transporter
MSEHGGNDLQLTRFHYQVFVACALLVLIDGYDGAILTYAAPAIAAQMKLDTALLGPLFAAHLVGTILGSGPSGLIADRRGRRPTVIWATVMFGIFTALTATAGSFTEILVYRLLTGIGLGAAASNTVALASEYSPDRCRATVVAVVYSALPLGALAGGYVGVLLIRAFGWPSVFVLGAALALAALVIALWRMPESIRFLRASGATPARLRAALERLGLPSRDGEAYAESDGGAGRSASPVKDLFVGGRAVGTLALWVTFFVNQMLIYFMFTWTPIVFKARGLSSDLGIMASATLNLGGVVGAVCLARLIDKRGARSVLVTTYLAAFLMISGFGAAASNDAALVLLSVGLIGFVLNGSNVNLAGVATNLYPTRARATGVGWAMGIGRAGAIVGALIGGVLLRTKMELSVLYPLVGSALLLAALAMWIMHGRGRAAALQAGLS